MAPVPILLLEMCSELGVCGPSGYKMGPHCAWDYTTKVLVTAVTFEAILSLAYPEVQKECFNYCVN